MIASVNKPSYTYSKKWNSRMHHAHCDHKLLTKISLYGSFKGIVPRYKGWLPANEAGRAHAVNEHGAWWIAGKFARVDSNLPLRLALSGTRHFKQPICSRAFTYQYSYSLVVHIAEDYELLHSTSTKSSRCMCSISANSRTLYRDTGRAHTSCTHFNWIFELISSLRSNYALYRDTMPLSLPTVTYFGHFCYSCYLLH